MILFFTSLQSPNTKIIYIRNHIYSIEIKKHSIKATCMNVDGQHTTTKLRNLERM